MLFQQIMGSIDRNKFIGILDFLFLDPRLPRHHGVKGRSSFSCGWVVGRWGFSFSSCVYCWEWTVHCLHSTWTVDSQLSMQAFFWVGAEEGFKGKEFPIAPHFYPICFSKCCPPFTYIHGPKGRNSAVQYITFQIGEPP